jgi:SAM-dependent methyltransferase
MTSQRDNTQKFSGRVENYVKYRPSYPASLIGILRREIGLHQLHVIADVGSGTGILTKLFLDEGNTAVAIEPNQEMREAADSMLSDYAHFRSLNGTAEATGVPNHSVDLIAVGQAFHWFDPIKAKAEFQRILKPHGFVGMVWNSMKADSAFWKDYEEFLYRHGTDYQEHKSQGLESDDYVEAFYAPNPVIKHVLPNSQEFDLSGFTGRFLSTSHAPLPDHPHYSEAIRALGDVFNRYQRDGVLTMEYDTKVYIGRIHA